MTLGQHLRANENVGVALFCGGERCLNSALLLRAVAVDAPYPVIWKARQQCFFESFGALAEWPHLGPALGTGLRQCCIRTSMVAAQ